MATTGSNANPFRYGGKFGYYTDTDTGLQLAGARWYSPNAFRWLSRDPIHYSGGENLYSYVAGRPTRYVDPNGFAPLYNGSDRDILVKPEKDETRIAKPCPPGEVCHVDGVFPGDPKKRRPVKIPDNCVGYVTECGELRVSCLGPYDAIGKLLGKEVKPRVLSPRDLATPDFGNWPNPYSNRQWR